MCLSNETPSASDNILGMASGVCCLSLPSIILIPFSTALYTARSLQNFSVVSNNRCCSTSSYTKLFNKVFVFLYSSSVSVLLLDNSIVIASLVGRLLYFTTKSLIILNRVTSSLFLKKSSFIKGITLRVKSSSCIRLDQSVFSN